MIGKIIAVLVILYLAIAWAPLAYGQRGVGDPVGIAAQAVAPEIETFTGEVVAVETGPCEYTTGHALLGTHVRVWTSDGEERNVHLGWADAVAEASEGLEPGAKVTIEAFRTDEMPDGHYVAKSLTCGDKKIALRDESLRPLWAPGGRDVERPRLGRQWRGGRNLD